MRTEPRLRPHALRSQTRSCSPMRSTDRPSFLHPHGDGPMPEHDDHKKIARVMLSRVLAVAERWFGPVDHLDYVVRRWLIPVPFEGGTGSIPHKETSMRSSAALSPVQAAIGQQ